MLDGLAVLVHVAQGGGNVVVSLSQQATVCRQVLQLQSQTLLEVFQRLWVVACGHPERERDTVWLRGPRRIFELTRMDKSKAFLNRKKLNKNVKEKVSVQLILTAKDEKNNY